MVSAPGTERLIKDTNSLINAFTDLSMMLQFLEKTTPQRGSVR
jgi:hypothetical protein